MKKIRWKFNRRTLLGALILAPAAFFTTRKANEYAADPAGAKALAPLFPETAPPAAANAPAPPESLPWLQLGGTINDASYLNKTAVYGIVQVTEEAQIQEALQFAQQNNLKVSIAAVRHSMGGQAFYQNALVLDMLKFNKVVLDEEKKTITVQSGATWHDIQNILHPKFAVKSMQSSDIFSVGGSIAVNAHGMDHQVGAIRKTIRSMRVMLADGSVQRLSQRENPELFDLVIGGYGLFGVVLDVELEVTENAVYATSRQVINYQTFSELFANELSKNEKLGLFYGHLSTAPQSLLREMILYSYEQTEIADPEIPPLGEVTGTKLRRFVLNFSKLGNLPMRLKWFAEKQLEPRLEACTVTSRNQAMKDGEACLVSRNEPMHDSVQYLKNNLKNETDILHEYFIPRQQFIAFVDGLRAIVVENEANLLNASVRVVHKETNFLTYAPDDMFSIVLYINQQATETDHIRMRKVTQALIDLAISLGGRFFLPYQLHYTPEQLERAYPQIREFFAAKKQYDPNLLFTNTFFEKYGEI